MITLFDHRGEVASHRRVLIAGVLFGVAGLVKIWAAFFFLSALVVCALSAGDRRRWQQQLGGAFAGLVLPALPFIINAPTRFFEQIVGAQFGRQGSEAWSIPIMQRLAIIVGSQEHWVSGASGRAIALAPATVIISVTVYGFGRRHLRPFDWFAAAVVVVLGALFSSAEFYGYYTYVSATALAVLAGVMVGLF